jgi:hypothetical protein
MKKSILFTLVMIFITMYINFNFKINSKNNSLFALSDISIANKVLAYDEGSWSTCSTLCTDGTTLFLFCQGTCYAVSNHSVTCWENGILVLDHSC